MCVDSTLSDLRPCGLGECTVHEDLIVDAANGVGAGKLLQLQKITPSLRVQVRNSGFGGEGLLNDGVGADFVQKEKIPPRGFDSSSDNSKRYHAFLISWWFLIEFKCPTIICCYLLF